MKKKKSATRLALSPFTLLFILAGVQFGQCQTFYAGEIIQNGETKTGFIKYLPKNSNFNSIEFKEQADGTSITLTAAEVQEFRLSEFGTRIVSVPGSDPNGSRIFAEIIIEGPASFAAQDKANEYVIIKDNQYLNLTIPIDFRGITLVSEYQSKRLVSLREVGKVRSFLGDCVKDAEDNLLTTSLVIKMVNEYNTCKQQPSRLRLSKKILIEPVVRPALVWLTVDTKRRYLKDANFDPSFGINAGLNLSFTSGSAIDRSIISIGLLLSKHTFEGSSSNYIVNDDATVKSKLNIEVERIFLPFALKRYRGFGQRGLYYGATLTPYLVKGFKAGGTYEEYEDGALTDSGDLRGYIGYHSFGTFVSLNAGYDIALKNKMVVLLGVSADYDPFFLERDQSIVSRTFGAQLNLGIRF
jgi:hypothetical protein